MCACALVTNSCTGHGGLRVHEVWLSANLEGLKKLSTDSGVSEYTVFVWVIQSAYSCLHQVTPCESRGEAGMCIGM